MTEMSIKEGEGNDSNVDDRKRKEPMARLIIARVDGEQRC